ncbi:MAG TPA: hypothetical protein VFR32_08215 [Gaiellaceae bacterium]|nr:hypothetical protein [Gaiellaceae bacterium]
MSVRWKSFALVALAGLAVGAGLTWAAIPDTNGVIQGCYKTVGGGLRVIDPSAGGACKAGEQSIEWPGEQKVVLRSTTQTIQPGAAHTFSVFCEEGERATGGGYRLFPGFTTPELLPLMTAQGSVPIENGAGEPDPGESPDGWKVIAALNRDDEAQDATVFVVCESP